VDVSEVLYVLLVGQNTVPRVSLNRLFCDLRGFHFVQKLKTYRAHAIVAPVVIGLTHDPLSLRQLNRFVESRNVAVYIDLFHFGSEAELLHLYLARLLQQVDHCCHKRNEQDRRCLIHCEG
jgi:hypothetical protein